MKLSRRQKRILKRKLKRIAVDAVAVIVGAGMFVGLFIAWANEPMPDWSEYIEENHIGMVQVEGSGTWLTQEEYEQMCKERDAYKAAEQAEEQSYYNAILQSTETPVPTTTAAISSLDWDADDSYRLAKIAMAEAEGEDTEGKAIEKVEQSEKDDCSFYNELVKLYGFAMKIYKNKIVVFNEATYEKKKSVATLTEQNIEPNWSWNTKLCRTYTGAKYEYTNNDKNQTIKVEVGGGNRILKVTDAASNASEAERITLAKINEANKGDTTMSVTMTRANRKIIATSCVTIKGFGKLDGKYYVEKVTWDIGSGCKQKLDLRRVADRFTDAKSSTKAVAKKSKTETKSSTATTTATKSTGTQTPVKGGKYTLTTTKKGYYTAAEALAGKVTGGHPTGTRRPGTYTIFNISQGMLNLTTKAGVPGSWINPN